VTIGGDHSIRHSLHQSFEDNCAENGPIHVGADSTLILISVDEWGKKKKKKKNKKKKKGGPGFPPNPGTGGGPPQTATPMRRRLERELCNPGMTQLGIRNVVLLTAREGYIDARARGSDILSVAPKCARFGTQFGSRADSEVLAIYVQLILMRLPRLIAAGHWQRQVMPGFSTTMTYWNTSRSAASRGDCGASICRSRPRL